ncbi:MAG: DUF3147 family protein [Candidatus Sulfotelmatobacter sp.]
MKIKVDTEGIQNSKSYEFVIRFVFGGAVTAFAGLVANRFGPEIGGLFLAFPAIVPATATLIKKREQQKKERAGYAGAERGRAAAAVDIAGAAMGGFGLIAFSLIVWLNLQSRPTTLVLSGATVVWFLVAVSIWHIHEILCRRLRAHRTNLPVTSPRPVDSRSTADRKSHLR